MHKKSQNKMKPKAGANEKVIRYGAGQNDASEEALW